MQKAVENVGHPTAGEGGDVQAVSNELRGVFRKLSEEHRAVAVLLSQARDSEGETRAAVWSTLRAELVSHERTEINHVYSEFMATAGNENLAAEHDMEADELDVLIAEVDELAVDSPHWPFALELLRQAVIRHTAHEEQHFFPLLQDVIGPERSDELTELYVRARLAMVHDFD